METDAAEQRMWAKIMDDLTRFFIERTTLLFIASRSAEGGMDVSPRGGQPSVVRLRADGSLLLPDYVGNKRLDTIGNILSNPDVALLLLNRHADTYLRIAARATVSQNEQDIAAFPADDNRPLSVMVLTPTKMEFVKSEAFRKSGFWIDPSERKPPLDVLDIYAKDIAWQSETGNQPVYRDAPSEARLVQAGLREFYGTPSPLVQAKAYNVAGPGFMGFIDQARFIVFARETKAGEIAIGLVGGEPLRPDPGTNQQSFLLDVGPDGENTHDFLHAAECALLAAEPGCCDIIRLNGLYREVGRDDGWPHQISMRPEEIYFHCSAAFNRSRIWADKRPAAWIGRRSFSCTERRRESPDVMSFVLKPRDDAPVGEALPGQFVTVSLPGDNRQVPRQRCYSISGTPDRYSLRITVRRVGNEGVSDLLHDHIGVGDEVMLGPPAGHFVLDSSPGRPVVLISAGVGITPLLPMAQHLAREKSGREVWFMHAARDARHHLFGEDLRRLAAACPSIRLFTAYSQPQDDDVCHHRGRLNATVIAGQTPVDEADFYICGPADFMSSLKEGLIALGAAPESVRMEAFEQSSGGSGPAASGLVAGRAPRKVTFAQTGRHVTWTSESGTLLDLALAHDVEVAYSCRNGECQSCVQRIISGKVDYPTGEEPLLARGRVMLCQAFPLEDIVIDC